MAVVHITDEAAQDVKEIATFLEHESPTAALIVIEQIERIFLQLSFAPNIGRIRPEFGKKYRSIPVGSYVIFYKIIKNDLFIVRVLHSKRDIDAIFQPES